MRIACTGHTQGIGKAVFQQLQGKGHDVMGFSKSTGFDIVDPVARQRLIMAVDGCDCFINNAYAPLAQTRLLQEMIAAWQNTNKIILNIGSIAAFLKQHQLLDQQYIQDKTQQYEICNRCIFQDDPVVINVMPGLVDTEMSQRFQQKKLDASTVANVITEIIEDRNITLRQVVFTAR